MEKINRIKNKYIFYNDNKEILILYNGRYTIFIPGMIEGQVIDDYGAKIKYIIDLLTGQNETIYLNQTIKEIKILKAKNLHLKKFILHEIKNYFSCYTNFTKDICYEINRVCSNEDLMVDLISISDFKQLIKKRKKVKVDEFLLDSLEELDERLSYQKY